MGLAMHLLKISFWAGILIVPWSLALSAVAEEDLQARAWGATCTGCHGTYGRSTGDIPSIYGIEKARFIDLMLSYKSDLAPATIMHQLAKGYDRDQINRMAEYFFNLGRD